MKILVLGDIHGSSAWKEIINKEQPDKTIFLGDYVSSYNIKDEDEQINNFKEILKYKKANSKSVVLLRGNHDMQHLYGNIGVFECSGYFPKVGSWCTKNFEKIMSLTQWIYVVDNMLFSHAGISRTWFKDAGVSKVENINKLPPSELFGFRPSTIWDIYGDSKTQGCTWIRPYTLARDCISGYTQFVGHTRVDKIKDIYKSVRENQHIILCDCMPKEYIVINDGNYTIVSNEKNDKS